MDKILLINIEVKPRATHHVAYVVKQSEERNHLKLIEVVENLYPHPEAPDHANVPVIEEIVLGDYHVSTTVGAQLVVLQAIQRATSGLIKQQK